MLKGLLSKAWSFNEWRGDGVKYFLTVLILFALLIYALSQMIGLEQA